ncbi:MAG: hypothetical protein IJX76_09515 [Clostridia bacterium]|nr:hypothetical protein [Clostridia bacterium]
MKNTTKKLFAMLLAGTLAVSMIACAGSDDTAEGTTTVATTTKTPAVTKDPNASSNQKAVSDYKVESVKKKTVAAGTPIEDVIAGLPAELAVTIPGEATGESESLYSTDFSSADTFATEWTACDNDGVLSLDGGKFATTGKSNKVKAYVTDPEWAKAGTEEYANYVVSATVRGTAEEAPTNNFGIIFRASNVTATGADSYDGMYVGIGDSTGQICVGKAYEGKWTSIKNIDVEYAANTDYVLTVVVFNDSFAVLLDGEKLYEGEVDENMVNGTVGLRTYEQLFECSEFSVRTLGAEDYNNFEDGYVEVKTLPVTWTCSDYDPNKTGTYGFFGTITEGFPEGKQAQVKVTVSVRAAS